ncbi:hypothetical protein Fcan01_11118 [Folsomia candida]|uniref:F-box domain-containing protein n=2 Tax=Folsomia candida TaxID=158441 RepID=A0A226EBJ8_FOLCA|nr:hypothetical protein Fcan01_11118 [Folsomia candida]
MAEIFANLAIKDLRSSRFVCRKWGIIGGSVLSSKFWLELDHPCDAAIWKPPIIHDKFWRRVSIQHGEARSGLPKFACNRDDHPTFLANCMTLLPNMDQFTQDLHIHVSHWGGIQLLRALAHGHFTILKFLSVRFILANPADEVGLLDCQNFATRHTLTKLTLLLGAPFGNSNLLASMCQVLINACANLEDLHITSSFYPDLTDCGKLGVFKYKRIYVEPDFPLLNRMLSTIPNSVRDFSLDYPTGEIQLQRTDLLNFGPDPMPNLTSLNIEYSRSYYTIDTVLKLGLFPKLEHLCITLPPHLFPHYTIFTDVKDRGVGVTSLKLTYPPVRYLNEVALLRIVAACLSVKRLNLRLNSPGIEMLQKIIDALNGWDLIRGVVFLKELSCTDVAPVLEIWASLNISGRVKLILHTRDFRKMGMRTQKLGAKPKFMFSQRLNAAFISCRRCARVEIGVDVASCTMSPNVRDNIKSFLEMQQIPIHFESVHGRAKFSGD